ncbi:MAG TPA: pantoate--beta-alanine ligase [Chthonomonadaceae bacterium]|nr:pantoate--beta-alanine ligase [Chthonomonadaceae bacterium]
MRMFQQIGPLRTYLRGIREEGKTVGFIPTMGALHEGHLTLIRRAKSDCDLIVVSIFVNPTQFGPNEDFDAYPRRLMQDQQLTSGEGVDALFTPGVEEMYPAGYQTLVEVPELGKTLEGAVRPHHFRGVATVVTKLLNIVQPDRAYFGQKDYQQFLIIERLARDLNLSTDIAMIPTVRDPDGLALSSRNAYLSPEERSAAPVLIRALKQAEEMLVHGETNLATVRKAVEALLATEPLVVPEYVAFVHPDTLEPVNTLKNGLTLVALAARLGNTRLIDNALIAPPGVSPIRNRLGKL